jgi:transposase-like protein
MRRYSEAVKADVRRRMSPPHLQSVARISEELGIHVITLYKWRETWRLQGEVVPASDKAPEVWSATDKFTVVLETAELNATEFSAYCRERAPQNALPTDAELRVVVIDQFAQFMGVSAAEIFQPLQLDLELAVAVSLLRSSTAGSAQPPWRALPPCPCSVCRG